MICAASKPKQAPPAWHEGFLAMDVPLVEAAQNVVPVAMTAAESVERLRNWASGRCLNADTPGGIYTANPNSGAVVKPGRKVRRDPSNN